MNYKGSCRCGAVRFETEGELAQVLERRLENIELAVLPVKRFNGRAL